MYKTLESTSKQITYCLVTSRSGPWSSLLVLDLKYHTSTSARYVCVCALSVGALLLGQPPNVGHLVAWFLLSFGSLLSVLIKLYRLCGILVS